MGDGSAVMQSVMLLQSGAAGNGILASDALQSAHDMRMSSDGQVSGSLPSSAVQNSWLHNGMVPGQSGVPADLSGLSGMQWQPPVLDQQVLLKQQAMVLAKQQQQWQHTDLQHNLQQANAGHALGVQLAQLHGDFTSTASAAQQQQQQQQQQMIRRRTASGDGHTQVHHQPGHHQMPGQSSRANMQSNLQQQQAAQSALRHGLLWQQQLQQQQQQLKSQQPPADLDSSGKPHQQHDQQQQQLSGKLKGTCAQPGGGSSSSSKAGVAASHTMHVVAASSIVGSSGSNGHQLRTWLPSSEAAGSKGQAGGLSRAVRPSNSSSNGSSKPPPAANGPPSSNLTIRMTVQLVATYTKCTPPGAAAAGAVPQPLPRRVLTKPAAAVKNDGWDNEASDLVLCTQVGAALP
jgi:hypothetical protein